MDRTRDHAGKIRLMANGRAQEKLLCAAIRLRICATVISIHYTGCITQVFFSKFLNFFEIFFFEGISPARRTELRWRRAGAQEGRQPAVFHPLVNLPFSLRGSGADCRHVTAAKMGNGSRVTTACLSPPFRSSQIAYCYTDGFVCAGATQGELPKGQERVHWGITVPHNS